MQMPVVNACFSQQHILHYEYGDYENEGPTFVCYMGNFPRRDNDVHSLFDQSPLGVSRGRTIDDEVSKYTNEEPVNLEVPQREYYSISVGPFVSNSKFSLPSAFHVQALIKSMADRCGQCERCVESPEWLIYI